MRRTVMRTLSDQIMMMKSDESDYADEEEEEEDSDENTADYDDKDDEEDSNENTSDNLDSDEKTSEEDDEEDSDYDEDDEEDNDEKTLVRSDDYDDEDDKDDSDENIPHHSSDQSSQIMMSKLLPFSSIRLPDDKNYLIDKVDYYEHREDVHSTLCNDDKKTPVASDYDDEEEDSNENTSVASEEHNDDDVVQYIGVGLKLAVMFRNQPPRGSFVADQPKIEEQTEADDMQSLGASVGNISTVKMPAYPPLPEEPRGNRNLLCRIGLRFPDGGRVFRDFLPTDPIQLLWSFCYSELGEAEMRSFRLIEATPGASRRSDYGSELTLQESGHSNCMILVTWE